MIIEMYTFNAPPKSFIMFLHNHMFNENSHYRTSAAFFEIYDNKGIFYQ